MKLFLSISITLLSVGLCFSQANDEERHSIDDFIIYSVKEGKEVELKSIVNNLRDFDVLFFGEEHNDSIGHQLQTLLFESMFEEFGNRATLSLEMFDRDVQHIMDEYLSGRIKESHFNKDSRKWKNYDDYLPMVEFAKEKGLDVLCANSPFRYVSIANSRGIEGLMELSDEAKKAMAPLPYTFASGKYANKLKALMNHSTTDSVPTTPTYNLIPGQSLWDATMAYSIFEYLKKNKESKVLHLNGRFHTEEYLGIVERLAEFNLDISSIVITLVGGDENYPKIDFEAYEHLGDYIIFTNPEVPRSY